MSRRIQVINLHWPIGSYRTMRIALSILSLFALRSQALGLPAEVSRTLKTFDFEERRLGNDEPLPMHWAKVHGPGLPHYVNGRLATDRHRSGQYSFRFDLNGGGIVYRYGPGYIKVQYGAHYRIDAYCQTTVLPNARARVTAYVTDVDGHPIADSVRHSELYAATKDGEPWRRLGVEVSADSPNADSLVIELELLQPMQYAKSRLAERTLFSQDIYGSAWWDDITVSQVPQVALRTDHPGNIFTRGEPLRMSVLVNDRFTDDLVAQLSIKNAEQREVYQRTGSPDVQAGGAGEDRRKRLTVELPPQPPGWYEVSMAMSSRGQPLGTQSLDFVVLPDGGKPTSPDARFGFIATDLPFETWDTLPQILPLLSAGRVKLPVWSKWGQVEESDGPGFDRLLARLQDAGITPTACLVDLPPKLADKLNGPGWGQLLKSPAEDWRPDLAFLVSRHVNHLERWQLGADGNESFVTDPSLREVYRRVYREFSLLADKPDLAMPWPAWFELSGKLPATVALGVPPSVLPSQLPLYLQDLRGRTDHTVSLSLQLLDAGKYGRKVQIRDLAQRVVYALAVAARQIDLPFPFAAVHDGDGLGLHPQELFLVMRTLTTTLSGARFSGRVALADDVEAFLFDRGGQGILVLWGRADVSSVKTLDLNLGERPVSIDLWGNVTPLPRPAGEQRGRVGLPVGPMPIFLVDIDGPQAQLRASVSIDRPLLESSFRPHTRHIRFNNSYDLSITGTLHLKGPPGWTLNPPTFNFSLAPGQGFDRDLTIQFPYNSFAGPKPIKCEFYIQGEKDPAFTVPLTLQLGLSDVGMQTMALRQGKDVIVQQLVTNYGESLINYTAFALFPRQARQERLITNLPPGATTIKKYRFENAWKEGKVRVGLMELEGNRILNDDVDVR